MRSVTVQRGSAVWVTKQCEASGTAQVISRRMLTRPEMSLMKNSRSYQRRNERTYKHPQRPLPPFPPVRYANNFRDTQPDLNTKPLRMYTSSPFHQANASAPQKVSPHTGVDTTYSPTRNQSAHPKTAASRPQADTAASAPRAP